MIIMILDFIKLLLALITWPKFSMTSYKMVNDLKLQGIMPNSVIDVGANVGQFAIASSKIFKPKSIYSFEPLPDCFEQLEKNTKLCNSVVCFNNALGEKESSIEFHVNEHRHSSSILPLGRAHKGSFPDAREEGVIKVDQVTLDSVFTGLDLEPPVLLKIDVQGYESHVLAGAILCLKEISYVVLEASFKEMYEGEKLFLELIKEMDDLGFDFSRPVGFLKDPVSNEILQADALFTRKI